MYSGLVIRKIIVCSVSQIPARHHILIDKCLANLAMVLSRKRNMGQADFSA